MLITWICAGIGLGILVLVEALAEDKKTGRNIAATFFVIAVVNLMIIKVVPLLF
jgi:hypothetical protein